MTIFFFGIIGIGMGVHEIVMMLHPFRYGYRNTGFVRAIFYAFMGFSMIGIAADLGIASGVVLIMAGAATLFFWLLVQCGCMQAPQLDREDSVHQRIDL
jgi:hypothetical protein